MAPWCAVKAPLGAARVQLPVEQGDGRFVFVHFGFERSDLIVFRGQLVWSAA
jgi:hypothetical protein